MTTEEEEASIASFCNSWIGNVPVERLGGKRLSRPEGGSRPLLRRLAELRSRCEAQGISRPRALGDLLSRAPSACVFPLFFGLLLRTFVFTPSSCWKGSSTRANPLRGTVSRGELRGRLCSRKHIGAQLSATRRAGRRCEDIPRFCRPSHASEEHRVSGICEIQCSVRTFDATSQSRELLISCTFKAGIKFWFQSVESFRSLAESLLQSIQGMCRQGALLYLHKRFFYSFARFFFVPILPPFCAGTVSRGELRGKPCIRKTHLWCAAERNAQRMPVQGSEKLRF